MTFEELNKTVSIHNRKQQDKTKLILSYNYSLASMIATMISCALCGKTPPKLEELYPDVFTEAIEKKLNMELIRQQLIAFAVNRNQQFDRGKT